MQRTRLGLVFYVDQNLDSNKFVKPLKALGVQVERHRDHFASNEADVRWIPYTAQKGWVAMTTDKKINGINGYRLEKPSLTIKNEA